MKGKYLLLAAAVAAGLATCRNTPELRVGVFEQDVACPLAEGAADSISFRIRVEYPVAGCPDAVLEAVRTTIADRIFGGGELSDAARDYIDAAVADYRENAGDLLRWASEQGVDSAALNWEEQISGYVYDHFRDLLSYGIYTYSYQGGAHGLSALQGLVFDLADGSLVTESAFFIPGFREELSGLLTAHLREALPDDDAYEALFVKDIEPNGNFLVSEKGVTYIYGPYEIGPYYLGGIEVTVPWEEAEPLLARPGPDRG